MALKLKRFSNVISRNNDIIRDQNDLTSHIDSRWNLTQLSNYKEDLFGDDEEEQDQIGAIKSIEDADRRKAKNTPGPG